MADTQQPDGEQALPYGLPAAFLHASPSQSFLYTAVLGAPPGRLFGMRVRREQSGGVEVEGRE